MSINTKYKPDITVQDYSAKSMIDKVELSKLKLHTDDGGNFLEIFRISDSQVEGLKTSFEVQQVSMSVMYPSVVKAYHVHQHQDDLWFVPPSHRLLVNLHDVREGSATFDQHMRLVLGGGEARLLRIPAGVAHGVKNCYHQTMFLFYATNQQFNPQAPDEQRLPWDRFGADLWELSKG